MKNYNYFFYSRLWTWRYLCSFFVVGLIVFLGFLIFKGLYFLWDNIDSLLFLWGVVGVSFIYSHFRERELVRAVEISYDEVKIEKENKRVFVFKLSRIKSIKFNKSKRTINGFGVKEMVVHLVDGEQYIIPTNIKNFDSMYGLISSEFNSS